MQAGGRHLHTYVLAHVHISMYVYTHALAYSGTKSYLRTDR